MPHRVAVFGAGRSGSAAIQLCRHLEIPSVLFDQDRQNDAACSHFGESDLSQFAAFVFSPGFASGHPWRVLCEESGLPCFGEAGFAASFWKGPLLGVTGTNGKSSVTTLLTDALKRSGRKAVAVGNIGAPLSEACLENMDSGTVWAVCELSSFQAELPRGLLLDGLLWTNFAEDHLDRYDSMEAYLQAKAKLLHCLQPGAPSVMGSSVPMESVSAPEEGMPLAMQSGVDSPLSSPVQMENWQLVGKLWRALNLPEDALIAAAENFIPLPHRLQKVAAYRGVEFWNDAKATNFNASLAAVESIKLPVYWIGGGRLKGGDLARYAERLAKGISAPYLYGEAGSTLKEHLSDYFKEVSVFVRLEDAVAAAYHDALADAPVAVLLSPGFSSFDQFSSFEARGECFTETVLSLKQSAEVY